MQQHSFSTVITKSLTLDYLLWLPENYHTDSEPIPLVLFLHGTGERGSDVTKVMNHGLPKKRLQWPDCPFVLVAPQCPLDSIWVFQIDALDHLLQLITAHYKIDRSRQYVTGLSLGATGVYHMVMAFPTRFAAMVPVCGRGPGGSLMAQVAHTPAWIFHGDADDIVPLTESERMARGIEAHGGSAKLTVYHGVGHDSWSRAYDESALYEWLLSQRRS